MFKTLSRLAFGTLLTAAALFGQSPKTRLAVVGLDHDHVWGLLNAIAKEPDVELVAIADSHPELVEKAKTRVPAGVRFFSDFVLMLDEAKPEGVIVTTANNLHLTILRECAKRHIHYSTEKPMASTAADAREMARLAREAGIKLMVNYFNAWSPATHELFHRVYAGELGPVNKIIVQYGHQGPKEIGVSKEFGDWLYDPVKNGGGAIVDFGCYGAEWAIWLKGRPQSVYAYTLKLKTDQHNAVDDDATLLLEYPDATAVIQASWDWPYGKGDVAVYGPKGSLILAGDALFSRQTNTQDRGGSDNPMGQPVKLGPVEHETSNPIAYFVWCIRNDKPIENPLAPELNVGVNEVLDAAKESIRTGRKVDLTSPLASGKVIPFSGISGRGGVPGESNSNLRTQDLQLSYSAEAPVILSDTRGVDFGPYLARVVYIVRHNWYTVIPDSARLGEKGRVSVVFEIFKDGSVPQLRVVAPSSSDMFDRAAVAGIRASIPFPPLPEEFTGNHLVLQLIFHYNPTSDQRDAVPK